MVAVEVASMEHMEESWEQEQEERDKEAGILMTKIQENYDENEIYDAQEFLDDLKKMINEKDVNEAMLLLILDKFAEKIEEEMVMSGEYENSTRI